jgi:uncharacterized membrane protein YbhN (UPF0104 family)
MMRRMWPWLRILIGVGILAGLAWRLGTDAFVAGLRLIDAPAILAALGIGLLTTLCSAWRWCLVARCLGMRLPLPTAVADYYRALFLNAVLPAGILGDVHRAVRHGQDVGDVGRGVRAVVLERVAGQAVLFGVGAAVLLSQPALVTATVQAVTPSPAVGAVVAAVLAVVAGGVVWVRRRNAASLAAHRRTGSGSGSGSGNATATATGDGAGGLGAGTGDTTGDTTASTGGGAGRSRWRRAMGTTLSDVRLGLLSREALPGVMAASAAALAGHLALFLVATRVVGFSAPFVQMLPMMVLALVVMGLPINVGGWGPREAVSALAFGAAGMGAQHGLAAAVVYGVLAFVASLPGVWVLVLRRGRTARTPPPPRPAVAAVPAEPTLRIEDRKVLVK